MKMLSKISMSRRPSYALVAAIVVIALASGCGDSSSGADSAAGQSPSNSTSPTIVGATETTLPVNSDAWVPPIDRAIGEALGYEVADLHEATYSERVTTASDCLAARGWTVTESVARNLGRAERVPETYGEAALIELGLTDDKPDPLWREADFGTNARECWNAAVQTVPDVLAPVQKRYDEAYMAVSDQVEADDDYLRAEARYDECLDDLGYTRDSLQAEYDALFQEVAEARDGFDNESGSSDVVEERLRELDARQRELDELVEPCTNASEQAEREAVTRLQQIYLAENPRFVDEIVGELRTRANELLG